MVDAAAEVDAAVVAVVVEVEVAVVVVALVAKVTYASLFSVASKQAVQSKA